MRNHKRNSSSIPAITLASMVCLAPEAAQCALMIDNFSDYEILDVQIDNPHDYTIAVPVGNAPTLYSGTDLSGSTRALSLTIIPNTAGFLWANIEIDPLHYFPNHPYFAGFANAGNTISTQTITYDFDAANFAAAGDAIQLGVLSLDPNVRITLTADGASASFISSTPINSPDGINPVYLFFDFADFGGPGLFNSVTQLKLTVDNQVAADDAAIMSISVGTDPNTDPSPIPEPGIVSLLVSALPSLIWWQRNPRKAERSQRRAVGWGEERTPTFPTNKLA